MSIFRKYTTIVFLFLVIKLGAQDYSIQNLTTKDGLPSNIIYDMQQDKIGYLWIATEKGLVKFDGDDFTVINKNKTTDLFIDGLVVYAGLENGLLVKNKLKEQYFKSKKVRSIVKYKNKIIVGTIEGFYSLNKSKLQALKINSALDFSSINDMITTPQGVLIASSNGLHNIHNSLENNNLIIIKKGNFTAIDKSYNSYLATKANNEIIEFKNDSILKIVNTIGDIYSIQKIKNEVWVSSKTNGIEVFTLPTFTFKQKINKYNSLQTNTIYKVLRVGNNAIYIASNKGIYTLKNSILKNKPNFKPNVFFESFQVNHQNADSLLTKNNVKLSHQENNVSISFKTVNLSYPKKIQYRYQLNNALSTWSFNNTVQFPNLNSGKYQFQIQSRIGNQKSKIKSFSFVIETPFYLKAWFIFSVIITLLLAGYFYLDFYIKRINTINNKKINELKLQNRLLSLEQKALQLQMNPHFIFNVLNGIKALGNRGEIAELNSTISKFSILLRGMLNNSRKEEISLEDEIRLLENYIELEQRMSSKSFKYSIHTNLNNIHPEEILIPTMLMQPFVENCIKHAFEKNSVGEITVNFNTEHRFLQCSIIDNGIGIYQSQKRNSNSTHKSVALKVSKERLFAINPKNALKIKEITENNIIKGTHVSFKIPLKTDY
ncbi:histidine kinase [Polaribacter sp. R77954]|uniref:sensor histidine kinase n=1 Tax=Polaribacter sp. R77954 TaxID=3093870 RepID=UPI0037C789E1